MSTLVRTVLLAVAAGLPLGACATYVARPASLEQARSSLPSAPSGPLAFEQAVRLLVARHPQLQALRTEIGAVNLDPGEEPLFAGMQVMDGRAEESMLELELLSLLGVGPRRGQRLLARALQDERARAYQAQARALVGELAEAYAEEQVLGALESPVPALDLDAYERAGLVSGAALAGGRAALAEAQAELAVVSVRRRDARRRISELIGARPGTDIEPLPIQPPWPAIPPGDPDALLLARGDLQRDLAAYLVADRDYYAAIQEQWPGLMLGVGGNIELSIPMQMVRLRLPVGAAREARARMQAREAAWHRLQASVQGALHESSSACLELEEAEAMLEGALQARQAAQALIAAETERVRTDPEAFVGLVMAAGQEVEAARRVREARVLEAKSRVQAARAAGWPTVRWMEDHR